MDIRRMDLCALEELAAQLRSYIIDVVSVRQGHLGSNLGVVELAVALHYVFDTPDEPLVWMSAIRLTPTKYSLAGGMLSCT